MLSLFVDEKWEKLYHFLMKQWRFWAMDTSINIKKQQSKETQIASEQNIVQNVVENPLERSMENESHIAMDSIFTSASYATYKEQFIGLYRELSDEEYAEKTFAVGRRVAMELLDSQKISGDSKEMKAVKKSVSKIENIIADKRVRTIEEVDGLLGAYQVAIAECRYYCSVKNPTFETGRMRKKKVWDTLLRLLDEYSNIKAYKNMMIEKGFQETETEDPKDLLVQGELLKIKDQDPTADFVSKEITGASELQFEDFARVIGTHNYGQVSFVNGKLNVHDNHKIQRTEIYESASILFGVDEKATIANQRMLDRLFELSKERLGNEFPDLIEEIQTKLGAGVGKSMSTSVSRSLFANIIKKVGFYGSDVYKILKDNNANPENKALAESVGQMFDVKIIEAEDMATEEEQEAEEKRVIKERKRQVSTYKTEINRIIKRGSKLGVNVPSISTSMMDNMAAGNISLIRDNIFHALRSICDSASNLQNKRAVDINHIIENKDIKDKIAALVIAKYVSPDENLRYKFSRDMDAYIREVALSINQNIDDNIANNIEKLDLPLLSDRGSNGVWTEVNSKLASIKNWKKDIERVRVANRYLETICDSLSEITKLRNLGFKEGLNSVEYNRMIELGTQIDKLLNDKNVVQDINFVLKEHNNTRFKLGFKELLKLKATGYSFKITAEIFSEITLTDKHEKANNAYSKTIDVDGMISVLDDQQKKVTKMLLLEAAPKELVKKSKDENAKSITKLVNIFRSFPSGKIHHVNVNIAGVNGRLIQKKDNSLHFLVNKQAIPLIRSAHQMANIIEEDMISNTDVYGDDFIENILTNLKVGDNNNGHLVKSRSMCTKYLAGLLKKEETFFTNVSSAKLYEFAMSMFRGELRADVIVDYINDLDSKMVINGHETMELLNFKKNDVIIANKPKAEDKGERSWSNEQKQVLSLLGDVVYSEKTWIADEKREKPGARLANMLSNNLGAINILLEKPNLLVEMLDEVPIEIADMKEKLREAINNVLELEEVKNLCAKNKWVRNLEMGVYFNMPSTIETLAKIEKTIDETVEQCSDQLQEIINEQADSVLGGEVKPVDLKAINKKIVDAETIEEKNAAISESKKALETIIKNSVKGGDGQGKFIKVVMNNYFKNVSVLDKRAMVASAIRFAKPKTLIDPNIEEDKKEDAQKEAIKKDMGNCLGGFLKGAGPLLQKILQGLPTEGMPSTMKVALDDMKSNLAPIHEYIVKAELQNIVDRSNGQITKINLIKALGAASVGQTFLCTVYGPEYPEGKEVVVKLLRPDVRNRMLRERDVIIGCAKKADRMDANGNEINLNVEKGGLEATYEGQLERIEEELDLTIEAKNAQLGSVYDKGYSAIKAMKVDNIIEPTQNVLVLEKAPGVTIDKYIKDIEEEETNILKEFYEYDENTKKLKIVDEDYIFKGISDNNAMKLVDARKRLLDMLTRLRKRQKYLIQFAENWIREGIYGNGFYQGDPHGGNFIINDDGLIVIDFGNATKLDENQQKNITRMMMAAAIGDADIFQSSFMVLLKNKPNNVIKKKFKEELKLIFSMGDMKSAGQRIAVALAKAQELGLAIPTSISNFSQGQLRLQNTVDEMNKKMEDLKSDIKSLMENVKQVDVSIKDIGNEKWNSNMTAIFSGYTINGDDGMGISGNRIVANSQREKCERYKFVSEETLEQMRNDLYGQSEEAIKAFNKKYEVGKYIALPDYLNTIKNAFDKLIEDEKKTGYTEAEQEQKIAELVAQGKSENQAKSEIRRYENQLIKVKSCMKSMRSGKTALFDELQYLKNCFYNITDKNEFEKTLGELCKQGIEENYDKIMAHFDSIKNTQTYHLGEMIKSFRNDYDSGKFTTEEMKEKENEIISEYERVNHNSIIYGNNFEYIHKALDNNQFDIKEEKEKYKNKLIFNIDDFVYDESTLGKEFVEGAKSSWISFKTEKQKENPDEKLLKEKKTKFLEYYVSGMEKMLSASAMQIDDYFDTSLPDDFIDVMGELIQSNLKASISKLGRIEAFKNRDKFNAS